MDKLQACSQLLSAVIGFRCAVCLAEASSIAHSRVSLFKLGWSVVWSLSLDGWALGPVLAT